MSAPAKTERPPNRAERRAVRAPRWQPPAAMTTGQYKAWRKLLALRRTFKGVLATADAARVAGLLRPKGGA